MQPADSVVVAVANPTAPGAADIVFLAETSAVEAVQQQTSKQLQHKGWKAHWGRPFPSHATTRRSGESLRGLAAGVALAMRLRSRSPITPRLGAFEVRCIVIYGKPSNHADRSEFIYSLVHYAYQRISECKVPTLVAGDFNQPVRELPAVQQLLSRGFQEAFALRQARAGEVLPPTCRNATRNDTCLIDPALVPMWQASWTLQDAHLFDSHSPLCIRLALPRNLPTLSKDFDSALQRQPL